MDGELAAEDGLITHHVAKFSKVFLQHLINFLYPMVTDAHVFSISFELGYHFDDLVYDVGCILDVLSLGEKQHVLSGDVVALTKDGKLVVAIETGIGVCGEYHVIGW